MAILLPIFHVQMWGLWDSKVETILNIEGMNQINLIQPDISQNIFNVSNIEQEVNLQSNEIQGI